jgi:transcriptional regulator with XRE-family HTH domain
MSDTAPKLEDRREFERELLFGEVGETVGALLGELGISQRELAERMGLSESRVSRIIGAGENVTLRTVADLGFALGLRFHLTVEELPERQQGPAAGDSPLPDWLFRKENHRRAVDMRSRDAVINARARELVALAASYFPQEFDVTGDADAWPLVGTGMLSRMIGTMKAILAQHPEELEADVGADVRRLYEQAVRLAWLAADPSVERIQAWRKSDLKSRLAADDDAHDHGVQLFTDEQRAEVEAQIASLAGGKTTIENAAEEADRYWAGKLPGMGGKGGVKSWRGFYAIVFRNYSGFTHPTYRGLNPVVVDLTPTRKQVRLEAPYEGSGPYGMATVIFGLGLLVAAQSLGWPDADEVTRIFERHPSEQEAP